MQIGPGTFIFWTFCGLLASLFFDYFEAGTTHGYPGKICKYNNLGCVRVAIWLYSLYKWTSITKPTSQLIIHRPYFTDPNSKNLINRNHINIMRSFPPPESLLLDYTCLTNGMVQYWLLVIYWLYPYKGRHHGESPVKTTQFTWPCLNNLIHTILTKPNSENLINLLVIKQPNISASVDGGPYSQVCAR